MTTLKEHLNDEVRAIGRLSSDPEAAHAKEDELREMVLKKIAQGNFGEASEWAEIVLSTNKYTFPRWCA